MKDRFTNFSSRSRLVTFGITLGVLLQTFFYPTTIHAQAGGEGVSANTLILLPAIVYTDEAGESLGFNGFWGGILGSSWNSEIKGTFSSQFPRSELAFSAINRNLFDLFYAEFQTGFLDAKRSFFYDFGNQSALNGRSDYSINQKTLSGALGVSLGGFFYEGFGFSRNDTAVGPGQDSNTTDTDVRYPNLARFGGAIVNSWYLFAKFDTRTPAYDTRQGQWAEVRWDIAQGYLSNGLGAQKILIDGGHYQPMESYFKGGLLAGRFHYERLWGEDVPFYLYPTLGGQDSLRAFVPHRWAERGAFYFNFEGRGTVLDGGGIFKRIDLAPFLDMGKVIMGEGGYSFENIAMGYGVGIIAPLSNGLPLRLDLATGPEGSMIYLHLFNSF